MSTAAWKSCATTQVRVAKPGRDTAPLWGGGADNSFGDRGDPAGGCDGGFEDRRDAVGGVAMVVWGTERIQLLSEGCNGDFGDKGGRSRGM